MPRRDPNGYIHYSREELAEIPPFDQRAAGRPPRGGTMGLTPAGLRPPEAPTLLTPAQVMGLTPKPRARTGAGTGDLTGGFTGPAPGGGIAQGGDEGAGMGEFDREMRADEAARR
ncbi:MAG: hypothetical protein ACOY93_19160 [Bacillota bacterium]